MEPGPGGFVLVAAPGVHAHAVIGVLCCGPQEILVEDGDAGDLSGVSLGKGWIEETVVSASRVVTKIAVPFIGLVLCCCLIMF